MDAYLRNLSENATIYVKENELDPVGATNNLRGLAAKIKFIDEIISEKDIDVKQQFSVGENPEYQGETEDVAAQDAKEQEVAEIYRRALAQVNQQQVTNNALVGGDAQAAK